MKTIFVSGATGQQGGAVVCHLLQQPGFRIRALTRNPAGQAAQAIKERGVGLVHRGHPVEGLKRSGYPRADAKRRRWS